MISVWPDLPLPGGLVRLPVAVPPMLCAAAGYTGGGRYVALYWIAAGDELAYSDATITAAGYWPAWLAFCEHRLGRVLLEPYRLGSSDAEAEHWLLVDRWQSTLDVGLARDVRQLLVTQPSELAAAAGIVGTQRIAALIAAQLRRPAAIDRREVAARLAASVRLVADLKAWLDAAAASLEHDDRTPK